MLPAHYSTFAAAVLAVGGLLACFAGYRLFRIVLGLYGFLAGVYITTSMMGASSTFALIVAGLVGGLVGAVLMIAAYFVGVGLIGAMLAAIALNFGWHAFKPTDPPTVLLVIVCVLGALGALSVVRYVIVFGTAVGGAWTLIVGSMALMGDRAATKAASAGDVWILYPFDPQTGRWWVTLLWIGVALAGALTQLATTSKTGGKKIAKP